MTRFEYAQEVAMLSDRYSHFLLDLVPRFGKSLICTELIKKWNPEKILILSGANSTNSQWVENLEKYNPDLLEITDIYCYQSAHKLEDTYDVICLDEVDLLTTNRLDYLKELNPKHWIGMSGTLEEEHIDFFRFLTKGKFYHAKVEFEQAVEWGILPAPKIYSVSLQMDNTKRYLLFEKGKDKKKKNLIVPFNERWTAFKDKSKNALIQCTELEYHQLICEEFEKWKGFESEFELPYNERSEFIRMMQTKGFNQVTCRDKKMRIGNDRKKFFANIKNRWFTKLYSQLPKESRVLVFCNDIAQAELLNKEFSVHSKNDSETNESLIERFNNKEINVLHSVNSLARGVDFVDVDYLIIVQSSMKQGTQIQKFARSGLSIAPKTILMYYPQTQDEKYVNKFLEQFKKEWIIKKTLQ